MADRGSRWFRSPRRALLSVAGIFGLTLGALSFVNGRWLHVDRRPETTTIGGAIVAAVVVFLIVVTGVVVLAAFKRTERTRRVRNSSKRA